MNLKYKPDFKRLTDEQVKSYVNLIQDMIHCYNDPKDTRTGVLVEIWKDLTIEQTERLYNKPSTRTTPFDSHKRETAPPKENAQEKKVETITPKIKPIKPVKLIRKG